MTDKGIFWDVALLVALIILYMIEPGESRGWFIVIASGVLFTHVLYRELKTQSAYSQPPPNLVGETDELGEDELGEADELGEEELGEDDNFLGQPSPDISDYNESRQFGRAPLSASHAYSPRDFWAGAAVEPDRRGEPLRLTRTYQMAPLRDPDDP